MNLSDIWTEVESVHIDASMYDVFEVLVKHPEWPFLPVIDSNARVAGVVREYDLKSYAFAQYGRELIKRLPLARFLHPTLTVPDTVDTRELLRLSTDNANPDGVVVTKNQRYHAVLLTPSLLRLFERQNVETEVRLVQAQKMEAIGTLAGGIAHDLNNILTPILGYAELLSILRRRDEPIDQEMIDQIHVSATRAKEIVKQILVFSRHQNTARCPMSLASAVKQTLPFIRSSLPATIDIEMSLQDNDARVLANPDEMHRVLVNLCTNAYHAMRDSGGILRVTVSRHNGPVLGWTLHQELLLGDYLRVSVADTGTGIDPGILPRIFEPFFTTKKQNEGTGLGLPIVHGIVTRCQGVISVESTPGRGSAFHIYLPCVAVGPQQGMAATPCVGGNATIQETAPPATINVLFVDDEFAVTRLASIFLSRYGIQAETANDSVRALAVFREQPDKFDLLVTDQTMPGLTGIDLAREVLRLRPGIPVILCTGYSESVSPDQAKAVGVCEYVLKPPDFGHLAGLIRKWAMPDNAPV
jgi:signal transduction histidine kinase/CheY-like chemotaxis protein